jgi:hypothetical protein
MLVYVRDINNTGYESSINERFCITNREGWYISGYWSPDTKRPNCSQLVTLSDYVIWLLNVENGEMVRVIPSEDNTQKRRFTIGHGRRMEKASIQHLIHRGNIHGVMTS